MIEIIKKYNIKKISKFLVSATFILLFFTPTINELYEVYAHNNSFHCNAKNENHLHNGHKTFLYNNNVVNNYTFVSSILIGVNNLSVIDINNTFYKSVLLSKKLIVFFLRPPPNN